ncbi:hypothetical protein SKAU_G00316310 [Synaphobranchus kaupii]|uniref:Uncharacterized protein n=1 Tax=Synaphobranchus kaupii TaxID=118154 RepID=A0A9Q1ESS5_SYNKA|nr:hypothetical protein SKAU_G00316310 [Synaphobranchus kaupii]
MADDCKRRLSDVWPILHRRRLKPRRLPISPHPIHPGAPQMQANHIELLGALGRIADALEAKNEPSASRVVSDMPRRQLRERKGK